MSSLASSAFLDYAAGTRRLQDRILSRVSSINNDKLLLLLLIYLLHQKVATKCKHKTHKTHTKYNTASTQNKHNLDKKSLCKKLPDSKLDSSNSLSQRVYTVLTINCHKAARYTSITRQSVQDYITISVHFLPQ